MERGAWRATVHRAAESDMTESTAHACMAVCGGLTNSCERREVKGKGEKERYTHLNAEFQK